MDRKREEGRYREGNKEEKEIRERLREIEWKGVREREREREWQVGDKEIEINIEIKR